MFANCGNNRIYISCHCNNWLPVIGDFPSPNASESHPNAGDLILITGQLTTKLIPDSHSTIAIARNGILFSNCLSQSLVACCPPLCFVGLPPWTQQLGKSIQSVRPSEIARKVKFIGFVVNCASFYSFHLFLLYLSFVSKGISYTLYKKLSKSSAISIQIEITHSFM